MGLMGLMWLTDSCSSDEEPAMGQAKTPEATEVPVTEVRSFATYFDEYVAKTRAWDIPSGYVPYEGSEQYIGIAFTQDGQEAIRSTLFKGGDRWNLRVIDLPKTETDIMAGTYYLYGYIPSTGGITLEITDRSGKNGDDATYSAGAEVKLKNVPTVMSNDLCVVIGAKNGTDKETVTGLCRGDFAYTATAIQKNNDVDGNYVFLLFDHLYAALRIKMKVHPDYDALRTIKLKALTLSTKAGGTTSTDQNIITVDLLANDTGSDPITSISYEPTGSTIGEEGMSFWSSNDGVKLTTEFQPFIGHFMPSDITTLVLTSTYDVYDKNVTPDHLEGNLIRKGCKATNTMVLSELLTGQTTTKRGNRYTVNMIIQPTYLYVLSEPDLDSPTVTVTTN